MPYDLIAKILWKNTNKFVWQLYINVLPPRRANFYGEKCDQFNHYPSNTPSRCT